MQYHAQYRNIHGPPLIVKNKRIRHSNVGVYGIRHFMAAPKLLNCNGHADYIGLVVPCDTPNSGLWNSLFSSEIFIILD